jgi:hypothetical protein
VRICAYFSAFSPKKRAYICAYFRHFSVHIIRALNHEFLMPYVKLMSIVNKHLEHNFMAKVLLLE